MSLKDLLPDGCYEELEESVHKKSDPPEVTDKGLMIPCPHCGKMHLYRTQDEFRPFCSQRCKILDLGAWASDEMKIEGPSLIEDDDAEYASGLSGFDEEDGARHS